MPNAACERTRLARFGMCGSTLSLSDSNVHVHSLPEPRSFQPSILRWSFSLYWLYGRWSSCRRPSLLQTALGMGMLYLVRQPPALSLPTMFLLGLRATIPLPLFYTTLEHGQTPILLHSCRKPYAQHRRRTLL